MRPILFSLALMTVLSVAPIHAAEETKLSWLFVMTGEVESATATEIVINSHPIVVAFTDRPGRQVKATTVGDLVDELWKAGPDSFEKDPPNAAHVFGDAQIEIDELKSVTRTQHGFTFGRDSRRNPAPAGRPSGGGDRPVLEAPFRPPTSFRLI
jgi:hypothetical protein